MIEKMKKNICIKCGRETESVFETKNIVKTIRDKAYIFGVTVAVCGECGEEKNIPCITEKNVQEIDEQYREAEDLVSIEDIEKLMQIYRIGKAPLSLALGFGEVTIPRYLEGQLPSKEYSDVIKSALASPEFMRKKLTENRKKITDSAYKKAIGEVDRIEKLFQVSEKILKVIAYLFERLQEVTLFMLQKLLYFTQGVYLALYGKPIFAEDCWAWVQGPVYPKVYELFKDFTFNPMNDARFALLEGTKDDLSEEEKHAADLVINTFGIYGGKVLEMIARQEQPWKDARNGYTDNMPAGELMTKEGIMKYYEAVNKEYEIDTESGLKRYIHAVLEKGEKGGFLSQKFS